MNSRRISVKFCGGCNPRINRGKLASAVCDAAALSDYKLVYNSLDASLIIFISGCQANCAWRYGATNNPSIIVAGSTIDAIEVIEERLIGELLIKVKEFLAQANS